MSSDEIQRRVSAALDTPDGLDGDPELAALVAKDPLLQLFVTESKKLDGLLRSWRIDELSDAEMEAMAAAVEARLDDALPAVGDVTRAPAFDDDDSRRDPSGQTRLSDPGKPAYTIDRLAELESTEELSIPHLPPPPPSNVIPLGTPKVSKKDERVEIPTVKPLLQPFASFDPTALPPPEKTSNTRWIVLGSFLAAAAVLVVFGIQMMNNESPNAAETVAMRDHAGGPDYSVRGTESSDRAGRNDNAVVVAPPPAIAPTTPASESPSSAQTATTQAPTQQQAQAGEGAVPAELEAARDELALRTQDVPSSEGSVNDGVGDRLGGLANESANSGRQRPMGAGSATESPSVAEPMPAPASPMATRAAGGAAPPRRGGRETDHAEVDRRRAVGDSAAAGRATPEQSEVRSALESVRPAVAACAAGRRGVANIRVTFNGASGRVATVNVEGTFAGTPEGSCMARAVRAAHVGRFSDPTLVVLYPYALQ